MAAQISSLRADTAWLPNDVLDGTPADLTAFLLDVGHLAGATSVRLTDDDVAATHAGWSARGKVGRTIAHASDAVIRTRIDMLDGEQRWLIMEFADQGRRALAESLVTPLADMVTHFLRAGAERDAAAIDADALRSALDASDCGVIVVDRTGRMLFVNASAEALLATSDVLQRTRGGVRPVRYAEALRFHTALDCLMADRSPHDRAPPATIMLLPRKSGGRPILAVLSVPNGAAREEVGAIIRLADPDSVGGGIEPICRLLGLSPVEGRLARELEKGLALGDAAIALRIKPDTARAYLKQIFLKTGTHRQGELVALLSRYGRVINGAMNVAIA